MKFAAGARVAMPALGDRVMTVVDAVPTIDGDRVRAAFDGGMGWIEAPADQFALACPTCKRAPSVHPDAAGYEMQVSCGNCYDADCVGDPPRFVSSSPLGHGTSSADAIADWNEQIEDAIAEGR